MKLHLKRFKRIQAASQRALAVFTKTEQKLLKHNEKLAKVAAEIDAHIKEMASLKNAVAAHHADNTVVLGNLAKILRGGQQANG